MQICKKTHLFNYFYVFKQIYLFFDSKKKKLFQLFNKSSEEMFCILILSSASSLKADLHLTIKANNDYVPNIKEQRA